MIKAKETHESVNIHRFSREPLEENFVRKWRELNKNCMTDELEYKHLYYLLSLGHDLSDITDRDIQVAETVIQWLGSSVGQSFIRSVEQSLIEQVLERQE